MAWRLRCILLPAATCDAPTVCTRCLQLCDELSGYADEAWAAGRREAAAKLLAALVQRDADVRMSLISQGCLKRLLQLLRAQVG